MRKQSKLTLAGLIVVIFIIVFCLLIIIPGLHYLRQLAHKVVCVTHLKGLGTAIMVYSNDYEDKYPKLGSGLWSKGLGYSYEDSDFSASSYNGSCTITSSLYLLVREADVSPKSFICDLPKDPRYQHKMKPKQYTEFTGENSNNRDIVELWDFGPDPYKHISYAYQNPYGKYPSGGWLPASFAVMADMNPWFSYGNIVPPQTGESTPQIIRLTDTATWKYGNSLNHELKKKSYAEGQNVLFGDGHTSYEKQPNVGVKNDNIYTYWSTGENPTEQDKQGGTAPTNRSAENDAKSKDDSFLAI